MSVQPGEGTGQGPEVIELPPGDAAFSALMDALVPEEGGEAAGSGDTAAGANPDSPAGGAGQAAPPAGSAGGAAGAGAAAAGAADGGAGEAGTPTAGGVAPAAGGPADGGAQQPAAEGGSADRPAAWVADVATVAPKIEQLSTTFEERVTQAYQATALEEVRTEHANYFAALEKHPRLLVGQQVPAIGKEGMEVLRDADDARDWQEAVKATLADEVRGRAARQLEENRQFMDTVHASIDLFKNNRDLIPGTKDFDTELANRFASLAKPYEVRVEGKLQGYSIPVQPIIEQLRSQVAAERNARPAAVVAPSAAGQAGPGSAVAGGGAASTPGSPPAPSGDAPQAGIPSKAGNSSEAEDFSALFGTLGLPGLRI